MKAFFLLAICLQSLEAREVWSNDPSFPAHRLQRRRFSQESIPFHLFNIDGCPGQICGNLGHLYQAFRLEVHPQFTHATKSPCFPINPTGGGSITPLLALKPPCDQQDYADKVIDAALDKTNGITDQSVRDRLIQVAKLYRVVSKSRKKYQATHYPLQVGRYSLYCDKAPRHKELDGLVQKQDPTANGTIFFDPSKKDINDGTVLLGSQANTFPFGKVPKDFKPGNPPSGSAAGGSTQQSTDQTKPDVTADSSKPGDQQNAVASDGDQTDRTKTDSSGSGSTDPPKENSLDGGNQNSTLQNSQDPKNQNPNEVKTTEPDNEIGGSCGGDDENKEESTTSSTEDHQKQQSVDSNGNTDTKTPDPTVSTSTTATQTGQDQNNVNPDGPQTTGGSGGDDLSSLSSNSEKTDDNSGSGNKPDAIKTTTADPNLSSTSTQSASSTDPSNTGNQEQSVNPNVKTETNTGGPTVNSSTEGDGQNTVASTNDAKPNNITTTSTDPTSIGGSNTGDQQQQSTDSNGKTASTGCAGGEDDDDLKTESTESSQQNGKTDPLIDSNGSTTNSTDAKPTENSGSNGTPPTNAKIIASSPDLQAALDKVLAQKIDLSSLKKEECKDFRIEFGSGFKGRQATDLAYEPLQPIFPHPPALIMCDSLHNTCGVEQGSAQESLFKDCKTLSDGLGKVVKDGSKADLWNSVFHYTTTYATEKATGPGTGGKGDGQMHKPEGSTATTNSASTASTTTANANPQVQSMDPSNQKADSGNTDPNMNMNQNQSQNDQNMNQDMQNMNQDMQNMNQGMQNMNQGMQNMNQ
ncbi:hypothetical protein PTTG_29866 [Puccinia triticina 1-1 BBBD Race 1]|uniref:Uncharacterized protein n=2 Tax=Puccinia triticina TaxID=208348 RepID=A0A180G253_PUCT1|nr:uncharacterized protein PtA15_18A196 [Puccinia triticina]OAV86509.1 hypothetical protein PTTG_29866 [Puccinia triticina 1-1 BBBD Race 1]WAQ93138.1 hypothetical protein PtA15_18A196 [Puccinia triticina]